VVDGMTGENSERGGEHEASAAEAFHAAGPLSGRLMAAKPVKPEQEGGRMPSDSLGTAPRRSERVLLKIPIRVEGKDCQGNAFIETTSTLVVSREGGQIIISHLLEPGAVVKITNLNNQISSSFEVVGRTPKSLSGTPEWGVKCLKPEVEIWGVHFPTRAEKPSQADLIHVLLECEVCLSREMAALTMPQYRSLLAQSSLPRPCPKCEVTRDWRFGFIEVEVEEVLPSLPIPAASGPIPRGAEKRREKRLAVKLPLDVRLADGRTQTSTTENISKSGLCFACSLDAQVGDEVYVRVRSDRPEEERDILAHVMWRRPASGVGWAYYGVRLEAGA
jgi:hypothetical protein